MNDTKLRLLLFGAMGFLLSVKADGRFPLPENLSETVFQLALLPYSIIFVFTGLWFLKPRYRLRFPLSLTATQLAAWIAIGCLVMILAILYWQQRKYAEFGYDLNELFLIIFGLLSFGVLLRCAIKKECKPTEFLLTTIGCLVGTYLISILSFPLHPQRSDMLPLIEAAGRKFLAGDSPYSIYALPYLVPLTYLPGLWLAYLPAVCFGFDPRWIHLIAIVLASIFIYRASGNAGGTESSLFCGLFLMVPYLHYRHEIYLGVLWLGLSLVFFFHQRKHLVFASVCFGFCAATSQFSWVLIPLFLLAVRKERGWKAAGICLFFCLTTALLIILPFALVSPAEFKQGVFQHWQDVMNVSTVNFSYLISRVLSVKSLKYIQAGVVLTIYVVSSKNRNLPVGVYGYMAAALLGFLVLNPIIWVYFYLTVLLLMVLHICSATPGATAKLGLDL